jgi:hypothetical protein
MIIMAFVVQNHNDGFVLAPITGIIESQGLYVK